MDSVLGARKEVRDEGCPTLGGCPRTRATLFMGRHHAACLHRDLISPPPPTPGRPSPNAASRVTRPGQEGTRLMALPLQPLQNGEATTTLGQMPSSHLENDSIWALQRLARRTTRVRGLLRDPRTTEDLVWSQKKRARWSPTTDRTGRARLFGSENRHSERGCLGMDA